MENVRPTFLTVLCILTFIVGSFATYMGISIYTTADVLPSQFEEVFEQVQEQMSATSQNEELTEQALNDTLVSLTPGNLRKLGLSIAIFSLITIVGAVYMWGLKRNGFFIYLIGMICRIVAPMVIFGVTLGSGFSILFGFFGAIAILLYYLNLKHLR
jgi:hypothetical protein